MLEMCLIVAMVLQRFDLELLPDQSIHPKAALTLRPSAPVRVVLRRGSPNLFMANKSRGVEEAESP